MKYPFPIGILNADNVDQVKELMKTKSLPPYLAMNKGHCGTGAERVVFRCQLSNDPNKQSFQFDSMVAKETLRVARIKEHINFHKTFCETQSLAAHLGTSSVLVVNLWEG